MAKVMGEATVSADAIRTFHDQSWVIRCQKCRPPRTGTSTSTEAGGGDSLGRERRGPLPKTGTIDYFPSIDLVVVVKQASNSALRL